MVREKKQNQKNKKEKQNQKKITLIIGAPGTGKTYKIRQLKQKIPNAIIFCPTNSSAELCGGMTVYKYFECTPFTLMQSNKQFPKGQVIIFDEIFMFSADVFDKVLSAEPFKVICFGDPFQIHQSNQTFWYENIDISEIEVKYLTKYYRAEDPVLQKILTDYREKKEISAKDLPFEKIDCRLIQQYIKNGWTLLVGKKSARDNYAKKFKYDFRDLSGVWWYYHQSVMLINQYGNCKEITRIKDYISGIFYFENGQTLSPKKRGNKTYYLLERADIMTVNLAQGQTLDGVLIDFASFFEFGSAYTAISRVKSSEKIKMVSMPVEVMEADLQNQFIYT